MTFPDYLCIIGLALIGIGCWLAAPFIAFVVVGLLLLAIGLVWSRNNARFRSIRSDEST